MTAQEIEIEVQVRDIALDPSLKVPVILLEVKGGGPILPIWIGSFEANSIALFLQGTPAERPLTHDLFISSIDSLGGRLIKVVVSDLIEDTFLSVLHLDQGGRHFSIDARPSDGIALSLRAGAPIYVLQRVFDKAASAEVKLSYPDSDEGEDLEDENENGPTEKKEWHM